MVAAAVSKFDGSSEDITDPEIGQIKYYLKQYDTNDATYSVNFVELKSRLCEPKDLNFGDGSSSESSPFFPI